MKIVNPIEVPSSKDPLTYFGQDISFKKSTQLSIKEISDYIKYLDRCDFTEKKCAWEILGLEVSLFLLGKNLNLQILANEKLSSYKQKFSKIHNKSPANYISLQEKPVALY